MNVCRCGYRTKMLWRMHLHIKGLTGEGKPRTKHYLKTKRGS
jgi:hypothetical protein